MIYAFHSFPPYNFEKPWKKEPKRVQDTLKWRGRPRSPGRPGKGLERPRKARKGLEILGKAQNGPERPEKARKDLERSWWLTSKCLLTSETAQWVIYKSRYVGSAKNEILLERNVVDFYNF